jgi:putative O-methyltransferase
MSANLLTIDYRLRPAKAVERKMLCEAFRRLVNFAALESYRYVGFGSVFFSDFLLFHRALGLKYMVSIEREAQHKSRFLFNRPFGSIQCRFAESTVALPVLPWSKRRSIVWLDYTGKLDANVLKDIAIVCGSARSGSILVVTVNGMRSVGSGTDEWQRELEFLRTTFREQLPGDIYMAGTRTPLTAEALASGGLRRVYATMALDQMVRTCRDRSAALSPERKVGFQKLFDFQYQDVAKMLTVGGVLFEERERHLFEACRFDGLPFTVAGDDRYFELKVPSLTYRETRHLDRQMPAKKRRPVRAPGLTPAQVREYEEVYRWYPTFAETEL